MDGQAMYEFVALATTMLAAVTGINEKPINHPAVQQILFNHAMTTCKSCGEFAVHTEWEDGICTACYGKEIHNEK